MRIQLCKDELLSYYKNCYFRSRQLKCSSPQIYPKLMTVLHDIISSCSSMSCSRENGCFGESVFFLVGFRPILGNFRCGSYIYPFMLGNLSVFDDLLCFFEIVYIVNLFNFFIGFNLLNLHPFSLPFIGS